MIDVHTAEIKTATIEIKALTIGRKQVTLSVFRQLQEEDVINRKTGRLQGKVWGRVNYFWGACDPGAEFRHNPKQHLHVVWQKGEELRRACVYAPPSPEMIQLQRPSLDQYAALELLEGEPFTHGYEHLSNVSFDDHFSETVRLSSAMREHARALSAWARHKDNPLPTDPNRAKYYYEALSEVTDSARALRLEVEENAKRHGCATTLQGEVDRLIPIFDRHYIVAGEWGGSYLACLESPHLFIAV